VRFAVVILQTMWLRSSISAKLSWTHFKQYGWYASCMGTIWTRGSIEWRPSSSWLWRLAPQAAKNEV